MGAESSAQRDGKSQEDASATASASASPGELRSEVKVLQEEGSILSDKPLEKNGQISSMTSLNGHSEDNTLAEVGQPDGVSVAEKEEAPETADTIQDEVAPQVNGEKMEKESPDANDISAVEEKTMEQKPDDASEVGFKKIFRFVGFKFTLKKDKSEEKDPVKLLTVKDKEDEEISGTDEPVKKQEEAGTAEEESAAEEKEADIEGSTAEAEVTKDETTDAPPEGSADKATDEAVKEEGAEKEGESSSPSQETALSPFRKLFSTGLFSNLRKKTSIKKTKQEEEKEAAIEEETGKTEETPAVEEKEEKVVVKEENKEEGPVTRKEETSKEEAKEEAPDSPGEEKSEPKKEAPLTSGDGKSEPKEEAAATPEQASSEATPEISATTTIANDEVKQEKEKAESCAEEEKAPVEVTSEAGLLSSQDKAKPQGSPLKKLFTGAGLKKLSTKKQKNKKDTETKLTESGEQPVEQLQSSTESTDAPKTDSGPSSPEESGEHAIAVEVTQNESSQEAEGEVGSDGEKKKEGIIAWSSFKKLVTPKKRVKRSSESDDEAMSEKPAKSATLSSSESAALADKSVEEDAKEEKPTEDEPKTENAEKLVSSTEEPKKKMDTSVSWEALMCMGGPKKRTRRTSDSDDDETKIEEVASAEVSVAAAAVATAERDQEGKTEAAAVAEVSEGEAVTAAEPLSSPLEKESAWDTLKRIVMAKTRAKSEEKPEEGADQVQSDSETPKEESSFSLRKFFPGRRKKKVEKQASTELGSGEEDSDTPAVVPLSEYEEQGEAEQEVPAAPAAVQIKVSAEDRSPSWIPAIVDDTDGKHDQLSDIPEEAENAATPKSVDTDIAEDEAEDQAAPSLKAPGDTGRRLSTAEVKPLAPAPAAETTTVPQGPKSETAEEVVEAMESQISEIQPQTSVTVEDVPAEVASEKAEDEPPSENAEPKTNTILEAHACDEATAICTDLGTNEIAEVAVEKPAEPIVECVAVIHEAVSTEVSIEDKPACTEDATAMADAVLEAQVNQEATTVLETVVEKPLSEVTDIHVATESCEPQTEKVGVVNAIVEESEVVQLTTTSVNSPKAVMVSPITPTSEAVVCTQSAEVTEPAIETKEVKMDMEQLAASEENMPVKEVVQVVTEVISSTICETTKTIITKETEPPVPLDISTEEAPVITETVVIVASNVVVMENASVVEHVDEAVEEAATIQTTKTEIVAMIEQANEKMEEIKEGVQQGSETEIQSLVIAQAAVQDAVDKISEDTSEPKKPATPSATIPVQAIATTEKEIEITTETPVVTDTPVAVVCEKTAPKLPQPLHIATEVIDTIPLELTESLDGYVEEVEKKAEKELKQAVEVKVSEETVAVEEVVEVKAESEIAEAKLSKEDPDEVQEPDVKEAAEEEKPQVKEETEQEALSENKVKVTEIHMPVQVVLETAQEVEEPFVEEEVAVEFDSNGPVAEDATVKAKSPSMEKNLTTLSEETQVTVSAEVPSEVTEAAASQPESEKTPSGKCAEVMAQVIEVIEEAVKEIEPVSTEITAAS
ncbi:A-kinase anchor protein 12 [Channa argus]|uniref:A-kinase anchor protein 12 n=1 Tax=Channa argus TaxID=215402 RepID=A0A6G1QKX2_CHAAH|nr:A-kinase anchor protein 12 [Channa argus]